MLPGATYTLSAWVRGELNAQASGYAWALRLLAYNRQGAFISSYTVASGGGGSLTTAWQQRSGTVTLPGNATTVRVELFDYMTDGWVALDDVSLTGPTVTKYYTLGSQRVAMRQGGVLTYLHGDHLGSASLATDASGTKITDSDTRYTPHGVTRPGLAGTGLPTDRRFTGQREETSLGFYDYGARPYAPALGRFLQADTLVPEPANPQSLNRYSYTLGNPLRYTDPSGHYHSDVHYDCTQRWVYRAVLEQAYLYGLPSTVAQDLATDLAQTVAAADEDVDCKVCADASYVKSGVLHWLTHQEATALTAAAVETGNPIEFGRALHGLQDYGAHFGQGYVLEAGAKGQSLYARRLATDDLDPSVHGGLELSTRLENARQIGHLRNLDTDDYVPNDSWDRRMREESLAWIHQFAQRYFELNFGVRHPGDQLTQRQHILD